MSIRTGTILDEIVENTRQEVAGRKQRRPLAQAERDAVSAAPPRDFAGALRRETVALVAEVKHASPSRGVLIEPFDPVGLGLIYAQNGAAAISVLTEERFFQGRPEYLEAIRGAVDLPLLRKDFVFDPYQLAEARAWGADAVLLIVAMLDGAQLDELHAAATRLGLDVLVEAHTDAEVERAVAAGATLIGVNNRDLKTFVTTLATAERLRPLIPAATLTVAESGIETAADIARLQAAGYDAFLVGESLMRAADPGAALRALLAIGL